MTDPQVVGGAADTRANQGGDHLRQKPDLPHDPFTDSADSADFSTTKITKNRELSMVSPEFILAMCDLGPGTWDLRPVQRPSTCDLGLLNTEIAGIWMLAR